MAPAPTACDSSRAYIWARSANAVLAGMETSGMSNITRGERLDIMLTADELEALDSWRFSVRMPSRAAAIRELPKCSAAASAAAGTLSTHDCGRVSGKGQGSP